ncbi:hypothetical protein DNTS_022735 [Danionella cerebrum]|uniref:Neuromodulin n=1 Tax=Danionella cerebrum TaxID=2873325 RepID=A0A553MY31_9TELE|nr:hypothetical protein DNTS_022735 [Danionella translucida]
MLCCIRRTKPVNTLTLFTFSGTLPSLRRIKCLSDVRRVKDLRRGSFVLSDATQAKRVRRAREMRERKGVARVSLPRARNRSEHAEDDGGGEKDDDVRELICILNLINLAGLKLLSTQRHQVEKNDEADQEITQDENKPEDNAHKAATKIQASFRGHITRKKMKDGGTEEEENHATADEETNHVTEEMNHKTEEMNHVTEEMNHVTEEMNHVTEEKNHIAVSEEKASEESTLITANDEQKPIEKPNSLANEPQPTEDPDPTPSDRPAKEEAQEAPQQEEEPRDEVKLEKEKVEETKQATVPEEEVEEKQEKKESDHIDDSLETEEPEKKESVESPKPAEEAPLDNGDQENI